MSDSTLIREHDPFSGHRDPAEDPPAAAEGAETPSPPADAPAAAAPKVEKAPPKRRAPRRRRVSKAEAEAAAREVGK